MLDNDKCGINSYPWYQDLCTQLGQVLRTCYLRCPGRVFVPPLYLTLIFIVRNFSDFVQMELTWFKRKYSRLMITLSLPVTWLAIRLQYIHMEHNKIRCGLERQDWQSVRAGQQKPKWWRSRNDNLYWYCWLQRLVNASHKLQSKLHTRLDPDWFIQQ